MNLGVAGDPRLLLELILKEACRMKSMKVLVLIVLLLFPVVGLTQEYYTLSELREQAQAGWHEEYTDKFGRNIAVDIDVEVFGEELAPVLQTRIVNHKLIREAIPDNAVVEEGSRVVVYKNNPADFVFKAKSGEQPFIVYRSYGEQLDMNKRYMEEYGTGMTLRQMVDHLSEMMGDMGIEAESYVYDRPMDFSVRCKVKKNSLEVIEPAIYLAHFWQKIYELPILAHASFTFDKAGWPSYIPQLVLGMRKPDEYQITVNSLEEVKVIAEDIPFTSFQRVKENVENLIENGHIRNVFSIRLGYAVYNDPNYPSGERSAYAAEYYYLVPTWVVECIYVENPKKEYVYKGKGLDELNDDERNSLEYRSLIINANNGVMLDIYDRSKNGRGDADYKGYISWEMVQ